MPTSVGPNTFGEENLVFGYDTGDTVNSYEGPPTQNFTHANVANCSSLTGWDGTAVHTEFGLSRTLGVEKDGRTTFHVTYSPNDTPGDCYHTFRLKNINGTNVGTSGGEVFYLQFEWKSEGASYLVSGNDNWDLSTFYGNGWKTGTHPVAEDFGSVAIGNGWYRRTVKYTAAAVANQTPLMRFSTGYKRVQGGNYQLWAANITMTSNHPPLNWLPGQSIRSATQGLIDLTGNSTIDLTNVSFDSNAQMTFDGSNDGINLGTSNLFNQFAGEFAIDTWVRRVNAGGGWGNIIGDYYTNSTANSLEWQMMMSASGQLNVYNVTGGYIIPPVASGFGTDTWVNVVLSRVGSTLSLYANSNLIASTTNTTTFGSATGNVNIGVDGNSSSEPFAGDISALKIYNRGLTASEIKANYNAIKGRFNI